VAIVVQTAQDRVRDDLSTPRQPISSVWLTRYALLNALVLAVSWPKIPIRQAACAAFLFGRFVGE